MIIKVKDREESKVDYVHNFICFNLWRMARTTSLTSTYKKMKNQDNLMIYMGLYLGNNKHSRI